MTISTGIAGVLTAIALFGAPTASIAASAAGAATTELAAETAAARRVVFESNGERLVGHLYLPANYRPGSPVPSVIVTGAWTTVKEQMPRVYAAEMAARGFAALTFDFRGWGQSEGAPRQLEDPGRKTDDILAAAQFMASLPEVDAGRIGGLGICASSGYMADAVAQSPQLTSLALAAPWLHNREIVEATYGGADSVAALIEVSRNADRRYEETGAELMAPGASTTDETAIMYGVPYYTEEDRGQIPEWRNAFNLSSWEPWLTYDAVSIAAALGDTPVSIAHSEAAAIPQGARAFYAALSGDKSELWLDDVSQLDFYDRPEPVRQASDFIAEHFHETLK